jgi:hypothetical protein
VFILQGLALKSFVSVHSKGVARIGARVAGQEKPQHRIKNAADSEELPRDSKRRFVREEYTRSGIFCPVKSWGKTEAFTTEGTEFAKVDEVNSILPAL